MIYFTNSTGYMGLWAISNCYYIPMSMLIIMVPIFVIVCCNILRYIAFYDIRLTHDFVIIFTEFFNNK